MKPWSSLVKGGTTLPPSTGELHDETVKLLYLGAPIISTTQGFYFFVNLHVIVILTFEIE